VAPLSSQIKILAFDDRTAHELGRKKLKLSEWQRLLESVGERKPRAIIVDHDFAENADSLDAAVFVFAMKTLNVPLYVAADLYPSGSRLGAEVDLGRQEYRLSTYFGEETPPEMQRSIGLVPYGPDRQLQKAFAGIGHRAFGSALSLDPFVRVAEERVVPHWT